MGKICTNPWGRIPKEKAESHPKEVLLREETPDQVSEDRNKMAERNGAVKKNKTRRDLTTMTGLLLVCFTAVFMICILFAGAAAPAYAAEGYDKVAPGADQASASQVVRYGMTPIRGQDVKDGTYQVDVRSSSKFFRIEKAVLQVKDGEMTANITLSSTSYKYVYFGSAEAAARADLGDYVELKEKEGWGMFRMRVTGLNEAIPCAAFSKKKKAWYDRDILFDAGSLPRKALNIQLPDYDRIEDAMDAYEEGGGENGAGSGTETGTAAGSVAESGSGTADAKAGGGTLTSFEPVPIDMKDGEYSIQVAMSGGSGRASVTSPTWLIVKDGKAYARLLWSSTYYDYMIEGGKKYLNETTDGGNSTFTIPIAAMDEDMPVIADTTAMGDPVEIEYELVFYEDSIGSKSQIPQVAAVNVLIIALILIGAGGILNLILKRRRKQ